MTTLIIVACHAVYLDGPTNGTDESEWLIEPFQQGETPTFIEHIHRGVQELIKTNGHGLLAFSGGATKRVKTSGKITKTEAQGYLDIAIRHDLFGLDRSSTSADNVKPRIFTEPYATDSYQNILLSLLQYPIWQRECDYKEQEATRPPPLPVLHANDLVLPARLVVVSHEFKRARFLGLHLPAVRSVWPDLQAFDRMEVEYVGVNPPFDEKKMREVEEGDRLRGYGVWKGDLFGVGDLLSRKRLDRGWDEDGFLESMACSFDSDALGVVRGLLRGGKGGYVSGIAGVT